MVGLIVFHGSFKKSGPIHDKTLWVKGEPFTSFLFFRLPIGWSLFYACASSGSCPPSVMSLVKKMAKGRARPEETCQPPEATGWGLSLLRKRKRCFLSGKRLYVDFCLLLLLWLVAVGAFSCFSISI